MNVVRGGILIGFATSLGCGLGGVSIKGIWIGVWDYQ
jgi:hypothetical protein